MAHYDIDQKASEYLKEYAVFEELLVFWEALLNRTTLAGKLEDISELVQSAHDINETAGLLPEGDVFSDIERFSLTVRLAPERRQVGGLKDVPRVLKQEFEMTEENFKRWMQEEREVLKTALIDMEDLIESIDDSFEMPSELEELEHVIYEALQPEDPLYRALNQISLNLSAMWEDLSNTARGLMCLSLNVNDDVDRAALPAILHDH